jgi:hypothetical protein
LTRRLPRSLEEVRGLRAARWTRESTAGQYDQFGPDSQREQQDRAIERFGLVDTGLAWSVAHSGRTVATTGQWAEMHAGAVDRFDVLVVGYASRFARSLEAHVDARRALHRLGVAVLFADERILTSDEEAWDRWAREVVEAESYSRRLAKRIAEGYAAKFRRHADQAGNPTLGFRRSSAPPHLLELDPGSIDRAVAVFRRYALGNVSTADLALEVAMGEEQVRKMLRNPLYNGWAVRHRGAERLPAPWRADPPVSDDLWERVADVRASNTRGGGPRRVDRADPLLGLLWCVCGRRIRADGMMGSGASQRRARMHPDPCEAWGSQARYAAETWELPIADQVAGLKLDARTIAAVRRALSTPEPVAIAASPARYRRAMRELADEHLAGSIEDAIYLERLGELRRAEASARITAAPVVDVDAAIAYLEDLSALWAKATPAEQAELIRSIYARIDVAGRAFVGATLTAEAYAHGLALALPETVRGRVERPRQVTERRYQPERIRIRIPIVGRSDYQRASRTA